jgi:DNA-binding XRE family transcriptional regulator
MNSDNVFYQSSNPYKALSDGDSDRSSYLKAQEWGIPLAWLGDILIAARKEQGLSQQEVASRLNIYTSAYSRWEADRFRSASLERIVAVVQALDLDARLLVFPPRQLERKEEATSEA